MLYHMGLIHFILHKTKVSESQILITVMHLQVLFVILIIVIFY